MTDIDDAVSALVDPVITRTARGNGLPDHVAVHDCLLDRLDTAVHSSTSGRGAGGGSKAEKNVLDSGALHQSGLIRSELAAWCRPAGITPRSAMSNRDLLTAWVDTDPAACTDYHLTTMRDWANLITNMLNPRGEFQYAVPCVVCSSWTWTDAEGAEHKWPLLATYAKDDPSNTIVLTCRSCEATWEQEGIGELIEEVENASAESV